MHVHVNERKASCVHASNDTKVQYVGATLMRFLNLLVISVYCISLCARPVLSQHPVDSKSELYIDLYCIDKMVPPKDVPFSDVIFSAAVHINNI